MGLRYEAWALPTVSPYERLIAHVPVIVGSGSGQLNFSDGGSGSMAVSNDWDRMSDLMSTTHGSLIKVYDGTTLVHEWITQRAQWDTQRGGKVNISGPDVSYLMGKSLIYMFDYTDNPTNDPDWYWGSQANLLSNGGFEAGLTFIPNEGFETGDILPWWAGAVDGVSATLEIESTTVDTGSFSAKCTPLLSEGGMSTSLTGIWPGTYLTVSMRINATAGKTIQMGISANHAGMFGSTGATAVVDLGGGAFEVQREFTAAGGWETQQFIFVVAAGQTSGQFNIRDASGTPAVFYVDVATVSGYGVGMSPWVFTNRTSITNFTASTEVAPQTGTYTGKVTATTGHGIFQVVASSIKGATYTAVVWLRTLSGTSRWALSLTDEFGARIAQDSVVATTTWQQLTVTGELSDALPGPRELVVSLLNQEGSTATIYFDSASLFRGVPAATAGAIALDLHTDASVTHVSDPRGASLDWLDPTFTIPNDSDSVAWASTLSFIARGGDTFLNQLRNLTKLDIEWEILAKATPSGALTHNLDMYESTGLGTDYTAAATPSILIGAGVNGASVIQRIPEFSSVLVMGDEGVWSENADTTLETNFGHWEMFVAYDASGDTISLDDVSQHVIDNEVSSLVSVEVSMFATSVHPRPLVDIKIGDLLKWQIPPLVPKEDRRVTRINYVNTEPTTYTVVGVVP